MCMLLPKVFKVVIRWALKSIIYCHFKELFLTVITKPPEVIAIHFSLSMSVSFFVFTCIKGHLVRYSPTRYFLNDLTFA